MDDLTYMENLSMNDIKSTSGKSKFLYKPTLQQNCCLRMEKYDLDIWMQDHGGCFSGFWWNVKGESPGAAGARGFLINLDEKKEYKYAWGMGHATNNPQELWALWKGIWFLKHWIIRIITIVGDSLIVISQFEGRMKKTVPYGNKLGRHIRELHEQLEFFSLYHIMRNINSKSDQMAN